ncbi:O-antigen ligase family protein [Sphingosinicella terrae]|uniref:O-antigen ligase family protein n=1 Tax=Sphingosinicella terrae TaxID=2172047 RepID=UPI0013B37FD1|nr:O-antigen ligase family protein [Sphingosinicella terrae]
MAVPYLLLCLVLGGASAAGILGNLFLQLLGALLAIALLLTGRSRHWQPGERGLWLLVGGWLLLIALQLAPLPPGLWSSLPGRDSIVDGFRSLGMSLPWLSLSLSPDGTLRALASTLPVVTMIALVAPTSVRYRQFFLPVVVGFGIVALLVGLSQVAGSANSPLYFYDVTNRGYTVGFFANRNHQATLLLMTLPFVAALATPLLQDGRYRQEGAAKAVVIAVLFAVISGGVMVTGSRAGMAILPLVIGFCVLMVRKDLAGSVPRSWIVAAALFVLAAIAAVGASGIVTRDALAKGNVQASTREAIWNETGRLALEFEPAGSGLGSFVALYRMNEDPDDRPDEFTNHAHNDYLEWLLETGFPGLLLLAAFLLWYALAVRRSWTSTDSALGRAGSIAIGVVLLHSMVDYPVRTAAIAALCGLCAALMVSARPPSEEGRFRKSASRRL